MAFLCVSQQAGSSKTPLKTFCGKPCQKLLAEKVEKKNLFPVVFSHRFCFIAFLAVSQHEEPKNTIKFLFFVKSDLQI
jgi:hypothetical protein